MASKTIPTTIYPDPQPAVEPPPSSSSSFAVLQRHNHPHHLVSHHHHHHHHEIRTAHTHDISFYASCYLAGGLSSSIRWVLSPLEFLKTRLQTANTVVSSVTSTPSSTAAAAANSSVTSTAQAIYRTHGWSGFFCGLAPTAAAYWMQTSIKYSLYEVFKDQFGSKMVPNNDSTKSVPLQGLVYVTAAASAELIADVFMCPFEMCRVQMQTNPRFPQRIIPGLRHLYRHRAKYGFPFGSLVPIWMRQVPGTIANFYTFETVVGILYDHGLGIPKESCDTRVQLAVTVVSGYVAGIFCAMVSHPADSLLSWKAIHPQKNIAELVQMIGLRRLATQGLATRMFITSQVIGMQWLLYDSFRIALGCGTTGSGH